MISRIYSIGIIGLLWVIAFQIARFLFFVYQYFTTGQHTLSIFVSSAWHGLKMDISFSAYLLLLPTLIMVGTANRWKWYQVFLNYYTFVVSLLVALIITVDLEIFRVWGFRLDSTPLHYLGHPKEAMASMAAAPLVLLILIFIAFGGLLYWAHYRFGITPLAKLSKSQQFLTPGLFIFLSAALIIPIRGGFQLAPMNESSVYYSPDNFANQLAVNPSWNFFSSLFNKPEFETNPFEVMRNDEAKSLVSSLSTQKSESIQVVQVDSATNVIIIIWESFTAKVVAPLGGLPNITPQFESLAKEGILFSAMYASGDRSDKGLISILSGYPAQPTTSIIKLPTKTASLPSLPNVFRSKGYSTSFYYGGETEFANIKSYLLQERFEQIIDKNSFDEKEMNSKWGAHDHVVLNRLMKVLDEKKAPFFSTLFTLSSHEPFEVPVKTVIEGKDNEHLFLNSLHYTDASIGAFIREAKTKPWWDNTLVIIIADHGHPMPKTVSDKPSQFHIPMLWLGGALKNKGMVIDSISSQVDLASTLLGQFGLNTEPFVWSSNLFQTGRTPFAFYSFNNGFGLMKTNGNFTFDNVGQIEIEKKGIVTENDKRIGRAYQQILFDDFLSR